jgi:hypothetical protein
MNAATTKAVLLAIRAAIHHGAHCCDVAHGAAIEQALQLASEAESVGITSIVGNGIAPGIINLMGVHVARQLLEVQQLQSGRAAMFWVSGRELTPRQWLKDPKESLGAIHEFKPFIAMMLQRLQKNGSRSVCDHRDGRWVQKDPIESGL